MTHDAKIKRGKERKRDLADVKKERMIEKLDAKKLFLNDH